MNGKRDRLRSPAPPRDLFPTPDEIFDRAQELSSQNHEPAWDWGRYRQEAEDELLNRAAHRVLATEARRKR